MDVPDVDDAPSEETMHGIKRDALEFVRRCNRKHRRALRDEIAQTSSNCSRQIQTVDDGSSIGNLVAVYTTWVSSSDEHASILHERLFHRRLVLTSNAVLHGGVSVAGLMDDIVAARPVPVIVAWKLHVQCALDFNQVLCRLVCPGVRKRAHPSLSRHIDVSTRGVQDIVLALASTPPAAKNEYSAILRHFLASYVDSIDTSSRMYHDRTPSSTRIVLRVAIDAVLRYLCDVARIADGASKHFVAEVSIYLDFLKQVSPDLAAHGAIQTLLKAQLLAHVQLAPSGRAASLLHQDFAIALRRGLTEASFAAVVQDYFWTRPWHLHRFWTLVFDAFHGDDLIPHALGAAHSLASHGVRTLNAAHVNASVCLAAHVTSLPIFHSWFELHFGSDKPSADALMGPLVGANGAADGAEAPRSGKQCPHPASTCRLVSSKRTIQFVVTCFVERLPHETSRVHLDVLFKVLKQHSSMYPDFVLHYIQLARRKLTALATAGDNTVAMPSVFLQNPPTVDSPLDVLEYITHFLDTGKVSGKLRQRILLQDSTWHAKLKPGLLAARDLHSHVLSLGWMQLVHTLARDGAVGPSEYAPFVAKMHTILQSRAARQTVAASSVVHLAQDFVHVATRAIEPSPSDIGDRLVRRLQAVEDESNKVIEYVDGATILAVHWSTSRDLLTAMWTHGLASHHERSKALEHIQTLITSALEIHLPASASAPLERNESDDAHTIISLARLVCVAARTHVDAVTAFLDKLVQPPILQWHLDRLLRLCIQFATCLPGNDRPTVPRSVHGFLAWMHLRHMYGGVLHVVAELEPLVQSDESAARSPHDTALTSWLEFELHQPTPLCDESSSYRFDCFTSHFMLLHESIQVAAITTVCSLGKELLRHQAHCFEISPPTCHPTLASATRLPNGQLLHPVWLLHAPTRPETTSPLCRLDGGMALFHQVVPVLFANKKEMKAANLLTALVNTFIDAAHTLLLAQSARPTATTARVCLVLVDLLQAVLAHSNDRGATTSATKLQRTVRAFVTTHLEGLAPWPPRISSMLHILLPNVANVFDSIADPADASATCDSMLIASLVVSVKHQPHPLPNVYTHLHAALCTPSMALPRLYTIASLHLDAAIDMTLNVLRHCMSWAEPGATPRATELVRHLHDTLSVPPNTLVVLDRLVRMYFASCSNEGSPSMVVPAPFLTTLVEMTQLVLGHDVQRCGQLVLDCAIVTSPCAAMWFLLLQVDIDTSVVDDCVQMHGTAWLERTCMAFLAYRRMPPDNIPIPSTAHARLATVLENVLASARRLAVPFATAEYLMQLRPVVSPDLQTKLEAISILEDNDDFAHDPTPSFT
ncbi:hypothetical protein H310_13467 [Aphanomyces invadans]|uniref:Uncharacterized protein n=1 Tax=Aphanomyces invadans TaxID=157072 RepID=A0A024TDJ8_9STRA|nr:hypothetical protein H310_13467 [Aphanomyces invadans]ETV92235.1 hypothetical protein H310_13467 [Aphanomyces invadans]|eukprot:XP_008879199.1 hypothetical protein H310_13467 [Aphanomyces invadans]